jgi:L-iditol 2-dehydrogenase
MKCCILEEPGRLVVAERPDPTPGPRDVVVRVRAALTCGTDLKAFRRGHPKMPCPTPFGHEFAGEIVAAGREVERFRVGQAVMSANTGPCGRCFFCERDQENLCETIMDAMILGAYAEYVRIPERVLRVNVFEKPAELPFEQAALLEPLSSVCFGIAGVPASVMRNDATALVIGAGPIALLWLVALRASGTARTIVAGRRPARLAVARAFGADVTLGEHDDVAAAVRRETEGRGADLVVECTGLPEVWSAAPAYARRGGHVVLFGGCRPGTTVALDTYRFHYDGVTLASPFHFRPRDVARAHGLLRRPDVDWSRFITSRAPLEETPAVFARLEDGNDVKCAIIPGFPSSNVSPTPPGA